MSIDNIIAQAVARAVKELYGVETAPGSIQPQTTKKEFEGNLTIVVFPWVKAARKSPEAVGQEIGEWLVNNEPAVDHTLEYCDKRFPQYRYRTEFLVVGAEPH